MHIEIKNPDLDTQFEYNMSLVRLIETYRAIYRIASTDGIKLADGNVLNIGKPSLMRTMFKTAMVSKLIPILNDMATAYGVVLEPPAKHQDLIDYTVNSLFDILLVVEAKTHVNLTSKTHEDSGNTIESGIAFIEREARLAIEPESTASGTQDA